MSAQPSGPTVLLSRIDAFARAKGVALYLVGGFLRDALMARQRPVDNIDVALASNALEFSRSLADSLGGTYVCLDEANGCGRVVIASDDRRLSLDVSDFRGPTIEEDLRRRDLTVNAMALPFSSWTAGGEWARQLIDPLNGRADLKARRLVACYDQTFLDDPLRIVRACRFAVQLDCVFEERLGPLMAPAAPRLAQVSGERLRDELFGILRTDRAHWAVQQLDAVGALDVVCPELALGRGLDQGGYHHLDVLGHQLETVAQCDRMLSDFAEFSMELREPLRRYCAAEAVEGRSLKALIKLAGLYHDVGKPATRRIKADGEIWFIGHEQFGAELVEAVTQRLRLSNREAELIRHLVLYHLRPGHLSREPQLTARAIFRFFRDLGEDGPACLLVWWADRMATRGRLSQLDQIDQQRARLEELIRAYFFKADEVVKPPRLIDGCRLMEALGLSPGPMVGELLRAIEEAQAVGQVRSQDDAIALAKEHLQTRGA